MRKKVANSAVMRLAISGLRLKLQQSQNDLVAAKRREELMRDSELKLIDQMHGLRRDHALQSEALITAYRERDDWRDAFKLIMKLVK